MSPSNRAVRERGGARCPHRADRRRIRHKPNEGIGLHLALTPELGAAPFDGVADEFPSGLDPELELQVLAVGIDRLAAQVEPLADLARAVTIAHQVEYFAFALAERI